VAKPRAQVQGVAVAARAQVQGAAVAARAQVFLVSPCALLLVKVRSIGIVFLLQQWCFWLGFICWF
jgi:hypothetical protein